MPLVFLWNALFFLTALRSRAIYTSRFSFPLTEGDELKYHSRNCETLVCGELPRPVGEGGK